MKYTAEDVRRVYEQSKQPIEQKYTAEDVRRVYEQSKKPKQSTQPISIKTTQPSTAIDAYTKRLQPPTPTPYLQQQTFGTPQPNIPNASYLQQQTLNTTPNIPLVQPTVSNSFGGYTGNQVLQSIKDVGRGFTNAVKGEIASNLDTSENNPAIRARNFLESIGTKPIPQYVPITPKKIIAPQMPTPKMPIMPLSKQEPLLRDTAGLAMLEQQKNRLQQSILSTSMNSAQERAQIEQKYAGVPAGLKTAGQLIGGVGQVLPMAAVSAVSPLTGMQLLYGQAAGGEMAEALTAGADIQAAKKAGISSGLTEISIEKLFGGIPFMGKGIANNVLNADDLVKKYIKSSAGQAIVKTAYGALGEGTEEVISEMISPFIKRAYYDKNAPLPTFEELAMAFGSGAVASAILGGASNTMEQIANRPQTQIQPLAKQQEQKQEVLPNKLSQQLQQQEIKQDVLHTQPTTQIQQSTATSPIDTIENAKQTLQQLQPIQQSTTTSPINTIENAKQTLQQIQPIQLPLQPPQLTPQGKAFLPPTIKNQRIMAQKFPNAAETISSGIKNNVDEAEINKISELSERMGVNIVFENKEEGNGRYQDGTIYINKNSQTPIKDTFIHELTHYIEKSGKYNDFANTVMDSDIFLKEIHDSELTVAEYKQRIKDDYLQQGVVLGDDGVNHEIVAKFAENYLSDEQTINRLARTNMPLLEKIKQWVDDMRVRFKGTAEEKSLLKMQQLYDKALKSAVSSNNTATGATQYSIEKGTAQQVTERAEQPTPINKKPMQETPADVEEVVKVLIKTPRETLPTTEKLKEINNLVKRKLVDSGEAIGRVSKIAKDPTLYYAYNNAKQAKQTAESMLMEQQSDIHGNKVGKSLIEIFEPIQKQGDKAYQDFSEYMLHMHNVDRMAHGKPIFGDNETAYTSRKKAEALLAANPKFAIYANDIYIYNRNQMQYRVDSGLVSREQADLMNAMYPHYVPTFRDVTRSGRSKAQRTKVKINQSVSTATGGESDILPLHANMARQTMQTIKMAKANVLGLRLYNNALNLRGILGEYVGEITPQGEGFDIDKGEENAFKMRNEFVVYDNGEPVTMKVNSDVFEGLEAIAGASGQENMLMRGARKVNNAFKELVTGKNPVFMLTNGPRDIQEAGLYTENLADFAKTYPKAFAEITSDSPLWRKYKALGGFGSSIFDYDQGYDASKIYGDKSTDGKTGVKAIVKKGLKIVAKVGDITFDKIEDMNFAVEQMPRFTEFMAQVKRGGEGYENLMKAMYMAADVTTNFGRSGTWGKTLNSTFVPFFNPAMQGTSKLIRRYTQAKSAKEWTTLVIRTALLGIAPSLINELIYGDDEEYKLITDREKDLNYLFKIKDGFWAKIPKGRVISVFGGAAQRTQRQISGQEDAWAGFISTAANQVLPINPFTNHILAQLISADLLDADSPGTTWYGTDIEPQRLRGFRPGLRFDEKTDYFSKWIGNVLNVSPKKINYLLDSYTGVIGDFALPLLTPQAERDPFSKAFTIDPVMNNKLSQQFYEKLTQLEQAKNDIDEPDKYNLMYRFMNKQAQALTALNKEIRSIEMSNISNADKKQEVREIKVVINGIQQNALMGLKEYNKAVVITGDAEKDYINANRKAFGAEYALKTYDTKVYEKAVATGVSYDAFLDAYFAQKDVKGNGEPLVASKNKMAAIDAVTKDLSKEDRKKLYNAFDVSEKVWEETLSAPAEKASSISTGKYQEYNKEIAKFKAEYYPGSTNEITASRKQKVYDYIKDLPLTKAQKTELYLSYYKDGGGLIINGVKMPKGFEVK